MPHRGAADLCASEALARGLRRKYQRLLRDMRDRLSRLKERNAAGRRALYIQRRDEDKALHSAVRRGIDATLKELWPASPPEIKASCSFSAYKRLTAGWRRYRPLRRKAAYNFYRQPPLYCSRQVFVNMPFTDHKVRICFIAHTQSLTCETAVLAR